ncbi:flagella basal body rod protein [Selenomonas sp. oral taxon 138 str. F0429]|nr:flagella basal body rod protein [Selenomonas sp. oral taxon 138 str. F0429]
MMRSMFSGVSGLKGHQTRMDVIGNNIANVNTTGFKSSRVTFADMISQNLSGNDTIGGVNPKQVGLGMMVASTDLMYTMVRYSRLARIQTLPSRAATGTSSSSAVSSSSTRATAHLASMQTAT